MGVKTEGTAAGFRSRMGGARGKERQEDWIWPDFRVEERHFEGRVL